MNNSSGNTPNTPGHSGHRERLKQRFNTGGADGFADYELLELILFSAIPRRDTKPLAKALVKRFGSFAEVLSAPDNLLLEISGIGQSVVTELKIVKAASERIAKGKINQQNILSSWNDILDYCRTTMAFHDKEQFRILFVDKKNRIIADEVQQTGTVDHTPVYPREIVKRALELSASAIILIHNHPSGDPAPSKADIEMTARVKEIASSMDIVLHDHIIVGKQGHTSFRGMGYL